MMFTILFILSIPLIFLIGLLVIAFVTGWNSHNVKNGFSDFVNSARWSDGK